MVKNSKQILGSVKYQLHLSHEFKISHLDHAHFERKEVW